ncbi:MAG: hypothetical protein IT559_05260 [Alphaproteobacteria bacterium]|nr:hypothetical protein [Alphaproteobacteria bacterium]
MAATHETRTAPSSLTVTNSPLPDHLRQQVYSKPARVRDVTPAEISGSSYFQSSNTRTSVGEKVSSLSSELNRIQGRISALSSSLSSLQNTNEGLSTKYYANVATINTQLQSGTTPGNPRLVKRVSDAQAQLETLGNGIAELNGIAVDAARLATEASFLMESTRAAYSLSGAVEEDHVDLAQLEDKINGTIVLIERVLNTVSDDITRTSTYLASERNNLRALTLGVANGDLYGKSLANRPFSSAEAYGATPVSHTPGSNADASYTQQAPALSGPRPLAKIRFDRSDVQYEQPIYMAVNEALQRYPQARFDLVAVHPSQGNAAEVAIESTKARRNAEKVLRTLTQMGLTMDRLDLSYGEDPQATSNEVHLYVKP